VAADDASGNGPDFAVACQMARDAANDSALDAPLCLSGSWDKRYPQNGGAKDQRLHGSSPKKSVAATIRVAVIGSGKGVTCPRRDCVSGCTGAGSVPVQTIAPESVT